VTRKASRCDQGPFYVDEAPLRQWILKAYHERLDSGVDAHGLVDAMRALLSGPEGGPSAPGEYYFERDPERSVAAFLAALNAACGGLGRAVFDPLLAALRDKGRPGDADLPPNVGLFVASLGGPVALRAEIEETVACALVSAALLVLSRLGVGPVAAQLGEPRR
jgi:hypothetical protein